MVFFFNLAVFCALLIECTLVFINFSQNKLLGLLYIRNFPVARLCIKSGPLGSPALRLRTGDSVRGCGQNFGGSRFCTADRFDPRTHCSPTRSLCFSSVVVCESC